MLSRGDVIDRNSASMGTPTICVTLKGVALFYALIAEHREIIAVKDFVKY